MSRLKNVLGNKFEDALSMAPHALKVDGQMLQAIRDGLDRRLYALISVAIAGLTGCTGQVDALRGPLDAQTAQTLAQDWPSATLSDVERAVLAYVEKGTLDEGNMHVEDVDALRAVGLSDEEVLSIAAAVSYQNYALRVAAALGVEAR